MTIFTGYITPNWNIEEFYKLPYDIAKYHNIEDIIEYTSVGHREENLTIFKCKEPHPMPKCVHDYIFPHFKHLSNKVCAVNLFTPGNYLPYHQDSLVKYESLFGRCINVHRYMIMLEDWQPGQILLVKDKAYSGWVSGDYYGWTNDEKHSFYNMSNVKRYALQITGDLSDD